MPCTDYMANIHLVLAGLAAFVTALTGFLVQRRVKADRNQKLFQREVRELLREELQRLGRSIEQLDNGGSVHY